MPFLTVSARGGEDDSGAYRISGPFSHDNLTVFLVHGTSHAAGDSYLTLQEAMEQKKIVVHETGDVGELNVENTSNETIFIQSGDIVKGGKQDRTIAIDLIVPPKSGRLPIASFCVESGRWSRRGNEEPSVFSSSDHSVAFKSVKMAAREGSVDGQQKVWQGISNAQLRLSRSVGDVVAQTESPSSLQLTMEDDKLNETVDAYVNELKPAIDGRDDVIGYAFAINGKINSVEVYASNGLFRKLWPKLLHSSAVEAVSERDPKAPASQPVSADDVTACIRDAESGKASEESVSDRMQLITRRTQDNVLYETRDKATDASWVRRSYMTIEPEPDAKE